MGRQGQNRFCSAGGHFSAKACAFLVTLIGQIPEILLMRQALLKLGAQQHAGDHHTDIRPDEQAHTESHQKHACVLSMVFGMNVAAGRLFSPSPGTLLTNTIFVPAPLKPMRCPVCRLFRVLSSAAAARMGAGRPFF